MTQILKWVGIAALVGLIAYLLIQYVPGIKFWERQRVADSASRDSILVEKKRAEKAEKDFADFKAMIAQDEQTSTTNQQAVAATVKLDVTGLSAMVQRMAVLESLVRSGLIKPADTVSKTPVVSYNGPEHTALAIQLRICDSAKQHYQYVDRAHAALKRAYDQRGDSMSKLADWIEKGQWIADQKGILTGRNKAGRAHASNPPFFKLARSGL